MTKKSYETDGGYYAIKGVEYQIDKTIIELLNSGNDSINIEQIQDIDSDNFVIQVKYKETAKLTPSQVNIPISKLIEEFKLDPSKKYILYAYFSDLNGYEKHIKQSNQITLESLDIFLGNRKDDFTKEEKEQFIENFELDLSSDFAQQFELVISKLKTENFIGNSDEEAFFYYANIANYLRKLVVNNPPDQIENRTCTKEEIFDFLKNGKDLIFSSTFRENQGEQKYFRLIKKIHFTWSNIDDYERFIIVALEGSESISEIKQVVLNIKNKFYNKSGPARSRVIKSGAPYVFIRNIASEKLIQLKTELLNEGIKFKDGHDFLGAEFSLNSIKECSTIHNDLCLKLINTEENLQIIISENYGKIKEIFQFYINDPVLIDVDIKNVKIQIKNISDIISIL